ncbi:MAG TPA: NTP transferase domain-containing protein [Methylomirabilota bacterium]|nr:NTP transferase domain-containing protein [Methylomirabilota bacterium]
MSNNELARGGVIAAGDGSRLRAGGYAMPKALVPVAGVPLIERVIENFRAAGVESLVVIVNEASRACVDWARARFPGRDIEFIVRTTASSLESFLAVSERLGAGPALISTVDAWCRRADFTRFVSAGAGRLPAGSTLGVTPLVADETPLWASVDAGGRITRLGEGAGPMVTAGFYLLSAAARTERPPAGLGRLRDYLAWLVARQPVYAEVIQTIVDVDRPEDVALAETLIGRET